jgi:hypothetical protein
VKLGGKGLVEQPGGELRTVDGGLEAQHALGQQRG